MLVGGFPRKKGMERKDLIARNTAIFSTQVRFIACFARPLACLRSSACFMLVLFCT